MRVAVVVGSHRRNGVTEHVAQVFSTFLRQESPDIQLELVFLAEARLAACSACRRCAETKTCRISRDDLKKILQSLRLADGIVLITPRYAPIPSKVAALLERLTSLSYFPKEADQTYLPPLRGKRWGVLGFDSQGTLDRELVAMVTDYLEGLASGYGTLATTDPPMPPLTTVGALPWNAPLEEHAKLMAQLMAQALSAKEKR